MDNKETVTAVEDSGDFLIQDGTLVRYKGPGGRVIIPKGVKEIGNAAFYQCRTLTGVVIPEGVTSIGQLAFADCDALEEVQIPEGVKSIFGDTFNGTSSLRLYVLPRSIETIHAGLPMPIEYYIFRRGCHWTVCYTVYTAARVDECPIYLGGSLCDLPEEYRERAVRGFLRALEINLTEILQWKREYMDYVRDHPELSSLFLKSAETHTGVLRFLIGEAFPGKEEAENLLSVYQNKGDIAGIAAILQYIRDHFGGPQSDGPLDL